MPLRSQPIPLNFPVGGVNENMPFASPPGQTVIRPENLLNARAYDQIERRNRGGQRSGTTKTAVSAVNGTNQIQMLEPIVEAIDLVQSASWGDKLTDPASPITGNGGKLAWSPDSSYLVQSSTASGIAVWSFGGTTFGSRILLAHSTITAALGTGNVNDITIDSTGGFLFIATDGGLGVCPITSSSFGTITEFGALSNVESVRISSDDAAVLYLDDTGTRLHGVRWTGSAFGTAFTDPATSSGAAPSQLEISNSDNFVVTGQANAGSSFVAAWTFDTTSGFGSQVDTINAGASIRSIAINPAGSFIAVGRDSSFFNVYPFSTSTGFGTVQQTDAAIGSSLKGMDFSPDGAYLLVGGTTTSPRARIYNFAAGVGTALTDPGTVPTSSTNASAQWSPDGLTIALNIGSGSANVQTWAFSPTAINPTAREQRIVTIAGGSMYRSSTDFSTFTLVASGSSAFDASSPQILSDTAFQKLFVADGTFANYQYLDFSDNTLKDWTSALTSGSLPRGTTDTTLGCRIIAVYRGRVVLAGLQEEAQNWFMSAAGDPFNWNYSPSTPNATQAVAGNNSDAGELGDIVTALAPYQDDVLIMGGANSVWVMRGDPAAGGRIDNITRGIGIVGPEAWCFDNVGNFYFFGVNGLYRMAAGGSQPQLISRGKLDRTFSDIDTTQNIIRLAYDSKWQGVGIFISGGTEPSTAPSQYFYDERNDAFFRDAYPVNVGPSAIATLFDVNPENNTVLLGGFDSFVRQFDDAANNDDGTAIDSFMRLPTTHPNLTMGQFQLGDMQLTLGLGGGASTTLDIYQGNTPEEAALATLSGFTATLAAGRNLPFRKRLRANALSMRLRNNALGETWAYEAGNAMVAGVGRIRAPLT